MAAPLVVVKAVTSRVSALPAVGTDIRTGLSVAAGGDDRLWLERADILDKVDHGAGRSGVAMVPVENLSSLGEVRNIVLSWMRPTAALTSQFFLSDKGEDVEMPLHINDGRPVQQRKVDFSYVFNCPQMTEGKQGVGPTEDRWDSQRILNMWCRLCQWINTQQWDHKNGLGAKSGQDNGTLCILRGSPDSRHLSDATGSVDWNRRYDDDADWFDGHPNRAGSSEITGSDARVAQYSTYIRVIRTEDWALSKRPAVRTNVLEYPPGLGKHSDDKDTALIRRTCVWFYQLLAGRIVMSSKRFTPGATRPRTIEEVPSNSSAGFLKRVSESNLDKLYDLPESIQDVMGLQALRPSAAVCKVMTIPDSNCNT